MKLTIPANNSYADIYSPLLLVGGVGGEGMIAFLFNRRLQWMH